MLFACNIEPSETTEHSGTAVITEKDRQSTYTETDEPNREPVSENRFDSAGNPGVTLTSGLQYIYLTTYKGKDVVLIADFTDHSGVKFSGIISAGISGYGLMIGNKTVAEPVYSSYEIIATHDKERKEESWLIAFSGDKTPGAPPAETCVYTLEGNLKGRFTDLKFLFSDTYNNNFYTFNVPGGDDEIYGLNGVVDSRMNVVIPAEYQDIRYGGCDTLANGRYAFVLDKKNGTATETYAGYLDDEGKLVLSGPYAYSGAAKRDVMMIDDPDGSRYFLFRGKVLVEKD